MKDPRLLSSLCHVLGAFPVVGMILCFLIWHGNRNIYSIVDSEGKKALNFQLTFYLIIFGLTALTGGKGAFLTVLVTIFSILAAAKTYNGEDYKYPFSFQIFK